MFFSEFNDHYWPTKLFKSWRWVTWPNFRDKKWFWFFLLPSSKLFFNFNVFSFFLYDLFVNKVRKLEVAVSNPIIEDIAVSFSLYRLGFLSFSFSFTFYLSLSLSLCLFVDSALQLLLCGVLILIINEL